MAWTKWEEQRHGRSPAAAVENASQRTEYARSSGGGERPAAAWTGQAKGLATSGSRALSTPMPMSYAIAEFNMFVKEEEVFSMSTKKEKQSCMNVHLEPVHDDKLLVDYIHKHGHGSWHRLPKNAGLNRCGKSCRLCWTNYLRPDIKHGNFTQAEEDIVIQLHATIGNKWSFIATKLKRWMDNDVKNHWNTHLRKKLLSQGINPVTHRPFTDLLTAENLRGAAT
ncbi:hypothetical protein E2562_021132 [Oryza meyeriana var. granulata]|uniref:HTH myb-type domain-containing protein n=1 Tax=Oryza meyeriana var. granulata TaxID=110450 RepID=A0A6G1BMF8_9ORYZ|nr:hypothetical protein E2562_021132 [Oryza meyeriana var. granulata]